jgi:hypothetical protein
MQEQFQIENPLVIMFEGPDKKIVTHIYRSETHSHKHYGLLVCDLVRHVARAFDVDDDDVWEWVDKERHTPTTDITNPN